MSIQYRAALAGLLPSKAPSKSLSGAAADFLAEIEAQVMRAQKRGAAHIEINSGELHRKIGGYPGAGHRMPLCCDAMYFVQSYGDTIISSPRRGKGASLTIRYKLPRPHRA
jgi:5-methylcytosine-specific restriction protein A